MIYDYGAVKSGPFNNLRLEGYDFKEISEKTVSHYRPPEMEDCVERIERRLQISTKSDVYSMGVLIYILCYKDYPFKDKKSKFKDDFFFPEKPKYSTFIQDIIQNCLNSIPENRPSSGDLMNLVVDIHTKNIASIMG